MVDLSVHLQDANIETIILENENEPEELMVIWDSCKEIMNLLHKLDTEAIDGRENRYDIFVRVFLHEDLVVINRSQLLELLFRIEASFNLYCDPSNLSQETITEFIGTQVKHFMADKEYKKEGRIRMKNLQFASLNYDPKLGQITFSLKSKLYD